MEEEQKWPTTALTLSWSTKRLATATVLRLAGIIPLNQFDLLAVNAACGINVFSGLRCAVPVLIAIGGIRNRERPGHANHNICRAENAVTRQRATQEKEEF